MTPDLAEALDQAVAATRVSRYRWLCSEANTLPAPNSRDDWRAFILAGRWRPSAPSVRVDYGVDPDPRARPCGSC